MKGLSIYFLRMIISLYLSLSMCEAKWDYEQLKRRDDVINIEKTTDNGVTHRKCTPEAVCKGINIDTIPYMGEHVLGRFIDEYGMLFDEKRTKKCLAGHNILILGDSVIEEFVFDLAILMSGIAKKEVDLDHFVKRGTGVDISLEHFTLHIPHSHVNMDFFHGRRNVTLIDKQFDIRIRHRFTGHYSLKANMMGLDTFFRDDFQDELDCLLGFSNDKENCPKPDTIILNSGLHDHKANMYDVKHFEKNLNTLIKSWKKRYAELDEGNVKIMWKGNIEAGESLARLSSAAERVMKAFNIPYVNIAKAFDFIPRYDKHLRGKDGGIDTYTVDGYHFGSYARNKDMHIAGTVSMVITQMLLHELCDHIYKGTDKKAGYGNLLN